MKAGDSVSNEQSALSLVLHSLKRRKGLFLSCWCLAIVVALMYVLLVQPIYRAELVLTPAQSERDGGLGASLGGQLGQLASFAGVSIGQDDDLQSNLAILESNAFTLAFIKSNDLLPQLYEDDWDINKHTWVAGEERTDWEILEDFNRKIRSIVHDPATGLVRLRIDWTSAETAAKWANAMGKELNERVRQRAIDEATESIRYLQQELQKTNLVGIDIAINGLIESQVSQIMLANVRKDYAFQVIDPAMAPSENSQLRPNRGLILALGFILGFVLSTFVALVAEQRIRE